MSVEDMSAAEKTEEYKGDRIATLSQWETQTWTVEKFFDLVSKGMIDLSPPYQRNEVWSAVQKSKLILSFIKGWPVFPVILAELPKGSAARWEVVDGKQRLTTIREFMRNELKLRKLGDPRFSNLVGCKLDDMTPEHRQMVHTAKLSAIVLPLDADPEEKNQYFHIINSGATKLSPQELRNALYQGDYNSMLRRVGDEKLTQDFLNNRAKNMRLKGMELVLHYLSMLEATAVIDGKLVTDYRFNAGFFDKHMRDNYREPRRGLKDAAEDFKGTIRTMQEIFGENACRRLIWDDDGKYHYGKEINMALYDTVTLTFAQFEPRQLRRAAGGIRKLLVDLQDPALNPQFVQAISHHTSDQEFIKTRIGMFYKGVSELVTVPRAERRAFTAEERSKLVEEDPTCGICESEVVDPTHAEVDHIVPYRDGGATSLENAQITHSACNREKGAKRGWRPWGSTS